MAACSSSDEDATASSNSSLCLSGMWQNSLGSTMIIHQDDDFHITGEYTSAVESREGVKGTPTPLAGVVKAVEGGSLVSWNVLWTGGKSMTTWVGQCVVLDGRKVIFASWLLKKRTDPDNKWVGDHVNQDNFWRVVAADDSKPPTNIEGDGENEGLVGRWISVSEDTFRIDFAAKTGTVAGVHLTPDASSGEPPKDLHGLANQESDFVAVAFCAAGPHEIKGWTGFIYTEGRSEDSVPVLETSWLSHRFSQKIACPRRFVKFGMDDYKMEHNVSPKKREVKAAEVVELE